MGKYLTKNEMGKGKGDSGRIPGMTDPMNNVNLSHAIRRVSRYDISFEKRQVLKSHL